LREAYRMPRLRGKQPPAALPRRPATPAIAYGEKVRPVRGRYLRPGQDEPHATLCQRPHEEAHLLPNGDDHPAVPELPTPSRTTARHAPSMLRTDHPP